MATHDLPDRDERTTVFLVERYLPRAEADNLSAAVARTAYLCAVSGGPGADRASLTHVQYLHSAYVPAENTCFCLFRAHTAEAVRAVNAEAGFAVDRISGAVQLHPDPARQA